MSEPKFRVGDLVTWFWNDMKDQVIRVVVRVSEPAHIPILRRSEHMYDLYPPLDDFVAEFFLRLVE